MMNRFHKNRSRLQPLRFLLPIFFFCLMLLILLQGLSSISSTAAEEEAARLHDAVLQGAVQCYALEGFYPEDLEYLETHYGLSYDSEKYVISYEVIGSNLMPDVTIIPLGERGTGS